jgi:hypothetical protein
VFLKLSLGNGAGKLGACAIAFFDPANPQDAVVFAVWM